MRDKILRLPLTLLASPTWVASFALLAELTALLLLLNLLLNLLLDLLLTSRCLVALEHRPVDRLDKVLTSFVSPRDGLGRKAVSFGADDGARRRALSE